MQETDMAPRFGIQYCVHKHLSQLFLFFLQFAIYDIRECALGLFLLWEPVIHIFWQEFLRSVSEIYVRHDKYCQWFTAVNQYPYLI